MYSIVDEVLWQVDGFILEIKTFAFRNLHVYVYVHTCKITYYKVELVFYPVHKNFSQNKFYIPPNIPKYYTKYCSYSLLLQNFQNICSKYWSGQPKLILVLLIFWNMCLWFFFLSFFIIEVFGWMGYSKHVEDHTEHAKHAKHAKYVKHVHEYSKLYSNTYLYLHTCS